MSLMRIFLVCFFLFAFSMAKADYINLVQAEDCSTIMEIHISQNEIYVILEIGASDYPWFADVIPRSIYEGGFTEADKNVRWVKFIKNGLRITSDGKALPGSVKLAELRPPALISGISQEAATDLETRNSKVVRVEIAYTFGWQKNKISIRPPVDPALEASAPNIGFVAYHRTVPVNDLRFLLREEILILSRDDPWYSYFENPELSRHHQFSLMSFLYVEPFEVRHEVLCRIKDLDAWIDYDYEMDDIIEVAEQDRLKKVIGDFLAKKNPIFIDGASVTPIIDRIHFLEINLSGVQVIEIPKPMPFASALIGVIFSFPHQGLAENVEVHWDLFSDRLRQVQATSIGPEGPWPYDLQPSANIMKWTNFLKYYQLPNVTEQRIEPATLHFPIFTLAFFAMVLFMLFRHRWRINEFSKWRKFLFVLYILLAIFSYPIGIEKQVPFLKKTVYSETEARELLGLLLKNTYRAFEFRDEGIIYDKLALCVDTDLLQKIYLQTRKSMLIENQGGIEARVEEVYMTKVEEVKNEGGKSYRCKWIARGEVGHWGHIHRRINQYDAIVTIRPVHGVWKLADLDVIDEVRL